MQQSNIYTIYIKSCHPQVLNNPITFHCPYKIIQLACLVHKDILKLGLSIYLTSFPTLLYSSHISFLAIPHACQTYSWFRTPTIVLSSISNSLHPHHCILFRYRIFSSNWNPLKMHSLIIKSKATFLFHCLCSTLDCIICFMFFPVHYI